MFQRAKRFTKSDVQYPRTIWFLGLGCLINVGGLSLLWPVNSIYIHTVLHQSMTTVGLVLSLYSAAGFLGSLLGGWMYDRFGPVRVLTLGLLLSALFILVPAVHTAWWSYVLIMGLFGTTCALPFPAMNALAGQAWPEGGRKAYNFVYVANNLGVAIGTALGGLLAEWSYQAVFYGIALAYTLYFVLVVFMFRTSFSNIHRHARDGSAPSNHERREPIHHQIPWLRIVLLLAGFTLCWVVYVQWQCTISVYMQSIGYSQSTYSLLWTLNGLLIFLGQPLIVVIVRRFPELTTHMKLGVILFATTYGCLLLSRGYLFFILGMVIMTFGEMFIWPSIPSAIANLAPPHRLGVLQGAVTGAATFGRMLGPIFGGLLYDYSSIRILLLTTVLFCVLPFLCFVIVHRLTAKSRELESGISATSGV